MSESSFQRFQKGQKQRDIQTNSKKYIREKEKGNRLLFSLPSFPSFYFA